MSSGLSWRLHLSSSAVADLPEKVEQAIKTLKTNPADPEANLVVGSYYCFRKDDWEKGLPMLAQGSDAALKQLATTELGKPTAPEEQKKLGDGWWDLAGSKAELAWKSSQQRAAHWYREAIPHLEGPAKAEVEKKLKGLDEQPPEFEVLARRAKVSPDESHGSARCTNLLLEVSKSPIKGPGRAQAALELKGIRFLDVAVNASSRLKQVNEEFLCGIHGRLPCRCRLCQESGAQYRRVRQGQGRQESTLGKERRSRRIRGSRQARPI